MHLCCRRRGRPARNLRSTIHASKASIRVDVPRRTLRAPVGCTLTRVMNDAPSSTFASHHGAGNLHRGNDGSASRRHRERLHKSPQHVSKHFSSTLPVGISPELAARVCTCTKGLRSLEVCVDCYCRSRQAEKKADISPIKGRSKADQRPK